MNVELSFPPATAPNDKAKYRQFLIDHGLDPNLNTEDLARAFGEKTDAEQRQIHEHWSAFVATL